MLPSDSVPRILVADDEDEICRLVRDALRSTGYLIDVASGSRDLLTRYPEAGYDLLIVDAAMVHPSGLEIVTKLRDRGDRVPIVLLSNPLAEGDRVEPIAFTYRVDVLRKPFGIRELRAAVDRALGLGGGSEF